MAGGKPKKINAYFFKTSAGAEPVRDWLKTLNEEDRRKIGYDIATVEFGWPIGMPVCRAMGGGLYEVRTNLNGNRMTRILFCLCKDRLVLLHGFLKKTRTTPKEDLALAKKRMKDLE